MSKFGSKNWRTRQGYALSLSTYRIYWTRKISVENKGAFFTCCIVIFGKLPFSITGIVDNLKLDKRSTFYFC